MAAPTPAVAASAANEGAAGADAAATARAAGRGGLVVSLAKMYFILTGLVQQVALKAALGLDGYGALSSVLAAASITYNPLVTASLQGVSHAVATRADGDGDGLRRVLPIHWGIALLVAGGFFTLAPLVGALTGAPHVVPALRLLSFVMLTYGAYAPLVGALNGRAHFVRQAGLDALAATLRTLGLIGGALWLGRRASLTREWSGVEGAALGFVLSSTLVLGIARCVVRVGAKQSGGPRARAYLGYLLPILLGQVLLNLLYQADQLLLRRFASDAALAAALAPAAADPFVGAYRATQLFCFLPYQLLLAVSAVLFPLVAATRAKHAQGVALYVQSGVRISLLVIGLLVSVTSGLAGPLLRLVFGADAAAIGERSMQLSSLGLGTFALFGVLTSVLNSLQAQRLSLGVTGLAFGLVVALCLWLVPGQALGPELLWRTAVATSSALVLATLIAAWLVRRRAGGLVRAASAVRVLAALAGAIAVGRHLPAPSALQTPLFSLLVAATYVVLLALLGELGKKDARTLARVLGRPRA